MQKQMDLVNLAAQCLSVSVGVVNPDPRELEECMQQLAEINRRIHGLSRPVNILEQSIRAQLACLAVESKDWKYNLSSILTARYDTEHDRRQFCLLVRLLFEEIVNHLLSHFQVTVNTTMPLADRVLFLKPHIQPAVRLNAFFDLKDYSSLGVHLYSGEPSMRTIEKIIIAVRGVIDHTKQTLSEPTSSITTSGGAPSGYKTKLCRNWQKYNSCPHGEKCMFAHGEHDVR